MNGRACLLVENVPKRGRWLPCPDANYNPPPHFILFPDYLSLSLSLSCTRGASLDFVIVDLRGCFAAGQAYVALSRATGVEALCVRPSCQFWAEGGRQDKNSNRPCGRYASPCASREEAVALRDPQSRPTPSTSPLPPDLSLVGIAMTPAGASLERRPLRVRKPWRARLRPCARAPPATASRLFERRRRERRRRGLARRARPVLVLSGAHAGDRVVARGV